MMRVCSGFPLASKRGTRLRGDHAQSKTEKRDDDSTQSHRALGWRGLVRLQGCARAWRPRAGHPDDPAAGPHAGALRHRGARQARLAAACRRCLFLPRPIPAEKPKMPLVLGYFQRRVDMDRAARIANQERLRALKAGHGGEVTIFNSHDPVDYENCRCGVHWSHFRSDSIGTEALASCLDAFSSREPIPTSLENALGAWTHPRANHGPTVAPKRGQRLPHVCIRGEAEMLCSI
jgi:hypothetical protein